jgi:hypothetical protein
MTIRGVLFLSVILMTSCAKPEIPGSTWNQFAIITSQGIVLATVNGTVTGLTSRDLTRLIRAGVAETYTIQCGVPGDIAATARQIFWQVSST